MQLSKITILGISINTESKAELLDKVKNYLLQKSAKPLVIVTPNPEQVVEAQKNEKFREILNSADIALPDGAGVVWALKKLNIKNQKSKILKRISGIDFMEELIKISSENNLNIGFFGGRNNVAQKSLEILQKNYVNLKGWAEDGDEFQITNDKLQISNEVSENFQKLINKIEENNTRLFFIALGVPKQEYFIENFKFQISNFKLSKPLVLMTIGGAFDIFSGKLIRAPNFIQNLNLEWLWRLIQEPWRWRRQLSLIKFVFLVLRNRVVG